MPVPSHPLSPICAYGEHGLVRYRGVDTEELIGVVGFEHVWALLVDGRTGAALPPAEPFLLPIRTGDHRVDMQSALAGLAPVWGLLPIYERPPEAVRAELARASVTAMSCLAQSARGEDVPAIPQREIDKADSIAGRFLMRWQGEADPARVCAVDAAWVALAADDECPSTAAARLVAASGADVAACLSAAVAACSGPASAGAAARMLGLLREVEEGADAVAVLTRVSARPPVPGLLGAGVRQDGRAQALRQVATDLQVPRLEAASALADAAQQRGHGAAGRAMVMFWAGVLLGFAGASDRMMTAMVACGRVAGWSAHIAQIHASQQGAPR